ncbi:MAG: SPOR domain-containing protein [Phormidesmis sp.]
MSSQKRSCLESRRLFKWLGIGAIAWTAFSQPAQADCILFSEPQRFNTQTSDNIIVIGHQSERPYRVVVMDGSEAMLDRIRTCVLAAYSTRSRIGSYIQIASFSNRQDAETIRRILRSHGYPTRVVYSR